MLRAALNVLLTMYKNCDLLSLSLSVSNFKLFMNKYNYLINKYVVCGLCNAVNLHVYDAVMFFFLLLLLRICI